MGLWRKKKSKAAKGGTIDLQSLLNELADYIQDVYIGIHGVEISEAILAESDAPDLLPSDHDEEDRHFAADAGFECFASVCSQGLADRLANLDESFAQTVLRLIDERDLSDVEVYKRANMSRQLFAKIRKDDNYRPTKKTACALAFALELNHDDALTLLSRAGFTLSHSSKFDIIIEFFLMQGINDVFQINEALFLYDQPLLG